METKFLFRDADNKFLIKYIGNDGEVIIPEGTEIIGEAAFASCYSLKNVIFPESLKEIRKLAFFNCINLEINPNNAPCDRAEDAFLGCSRLIRTEYLLKKKTISEIEKDGLSVFFVKDYQRGYRWTKNEIIELLEDIKETKHKYCLQPLIVKQTTIQSYKMALDKNGTLSKFQSPTGEQLAAYELIDGQQRLTTLFLILNACNEKNKPNYTIYYELLRNIDNHYMGKAKDIIDGWFKEQSDVSLDEFANKIRNQLFFIWYEMKTDDSASVEDEFRNINDGQTPLTNAELFKALLLNPENAKSYQRGLKESVEADLYKMAYEWDQVEQNLHDEAFWFFIANEECKERTHLDYLFELYGVRLSKFKEDRRKSVDYNAFVNKINELDKERDRFSFLAVKEYVDYLEKINEKNGKTKFNIIKEIWEEIVRQYHRLYSWFSDNELYHQIGFLVAAEEKKRGNSIVPSIIVELFQEGYGERIASDNEIRTVNELKKAMREKILNYFAKQIKAPAKKDGSDAITVFSDQYYMRGSKDVRNFLLYLNIWSAQEAKEKFPFHRFKNTRDSNGRLLTWDIEHVSARNLKVEISDSLLEDIRPWWKEEERTMGYDINTSRKWDAEEWRSFAQKVNETEQPDNSVSNLVLLDYKTNRSYGDALFLGKRDEIIKRDKSNAYIPICTKNVFLKYYTKKPDTALAWTEDDKKGYLKIIFNCIKYIVGSSGDFSSVLQGIEEKEKTMKEA